MIRREDGKETFGRCIKLICAQSERADVGSIHGVIDARGWIIMIEIKEKAEGESHSKKRTRRGREPVCAFAGGE